MTNITRAKEAYWAQKANAKARGKDWKFTLEEWDQLVGRKVRSQLVRKTWN